MNIFIARSRASILSSILSLSRKNTFPFCDKIESTSLSLYSRRLVKSSSDIIAYLIFFPKKTFSKKRLNSVRSKSPMMKMSTILFVFSLRKFTIASEIVTRSSVFRHLKNCLSGVKTSYAFKNISEISG